MEKYRGPLGVFEGYGDYEGVAPMTPDYDAITRAIKELPLGRQLRMVREIVSAKDFGAFTCDATNAIDFALDDMDAQAIEMLREEDVQMYGEIS